MIIQILSRLVRRGYLRKDRPGAVGPFFAAANLAVRRSALADIGLFDEEMRTGEDMDFCIRALESRWEVYFDPEATVSHFNRDTLRGLVKQWFAYGYYHAALFRKHGSHAVEVLGFNRHPRSYARYTPLFVKGGPPPRAVVFITLFATLHATLALALAARLASLPRVAALFLAVTAAAAVGHFREDFVGSGSVAHKLAVLPVRYVVNLSLLVGGLLGGIERRYLFVYGTLWRKASAP